MTYKLSPSILAADVSRLGDEVRMVRDAGAQYVHIDVMDGMFVPNISFGLPLVEGLRGCTDAFFDVHLMIREPIRYIERFAEAGADGITVHAEACEDLGKALQTIHRVGKRAGVALSPDTEIEVVVPYLDKLSMVLVMTVYPGYGGQRIIKTVYDKIRKLRSIAEERNPDLDIEVDGGVNLHNINEIKDAGANVFVAGTKIFKGDVKENVRQFMKRLTSQDR